MPISKGFAYALPKCGREYTELEAIYCVTCDHNNGRLVSQRGYAELWRWSRGRVERFAQKTGWSISKEKKRGLNKIEVDVKKDGAVMHDSSWLKRATDDTTDGPPMIPPTGHRRATDGPCDERYNSELRRTGSHRRTTDATTDGPPMLPPTGHRRDTTINLNLNPNPNTSHADGDSWRCQQKAGGVGKEKSVMEIPLIKKDGHFQVTENDISVWQETFPALDVRQVLVEIRQWNFDNPKNRKTRGGIRRHITGWMSRAQNRASPKRKANGFNPRNMKEAATMQAALLSRSILEHADEFADV